MMRAGVLRTIGTLGVVGRLGMVGVRRLIVEAMIGELVLAIIVPAHGIESADIRSVYLLRSSRLHHIVDIERACPVHGVLQGAHHNWGSIQAINERDIVLARAASARMEGFGGRGDAVSALAVLHLEIWVTVLTHVAVMWLQLLINKRVGEHALTNWTLVTLYLVAVLGCSIRTAI